MPKMKENTLRERRRRKRVPLRCALSLHGEERRVSGYTLDVSSKGFYCVLNEAFDTGDTVECILDLDFHLGYPTPVGPSITVLCEAVVTRTEETTEGYGTAFEIMQYRIVQTTKCCNNHVN